jgi:hypothetical protein
MSKEPEKKDETEPQDDSDLDGEQAADEDEDAADEEQDEHQSSADEERDEDEDEGSDGDARPKPKQEAETAEQSDEPAGAKAHADDAPAKDDPSAEPKAPKSRGERDRAAGPGKRKGSRPSGKLGSKASAKVVVAPPKKGSRIPSILLYAVLIGAIALAFAFLGQQDGGGEAEVPQPKWNAGDTVDVAITLVTTDYKDLACGTEEVLKDLHCGFADKRKPHPKGNDVRTDPNVLQPYTTIERVQFLAAGMWTQPELKAMLDAENWNNPSPRFTVDCKFKVAGKMKEANIRWKPEADWLPASGRDWYTGSLSDCKVRAQKKPTPPPKPAESK